MKKMLTFLVLLFIATASQAQLPRPTQKIYQLYQLRNWTATANFTTTRTVCPTACDYATIEDAIAFVASQTRALNKQWTILIHGGESASATPNMNYTVDSLNVPSFTTLRGYVGTSPSGGSINATPIPVIELTKTSGVQITLNEASGLSSLNFYTNATLTGNSTMLKTTGNDFNYITDVQLWGNPLTGAFTFDILDIQSLATVGMNLNTVRGQNGSSATVRNVVVNGSATTLWFGRHQPGQGTSQAKTVEVISGTLTMNYSRIISGATTALTVTGGTVTNRFSAIPSYSGAVTTDIVYLPNGSSNPGTCSIGQTFINTTSGVKVCTAANTWTAVPRFVAAPSAATDACTVGDVAIATGLFYTCVATNTWQRVVTLTW